MDILREVSACRNVSRCRVELHPAFRRRTILDRQPLLVSGQEFAGRRRGANMSTDPLRAEGASRSRNCESVVRPEHPAA